MNVKYKGAKKSSKKNRPYSVPLFWHRTWYINIMKITSETIDNSPIEQRQIRWILYQWNTTEFWEVWHNLILTIEASVSFPFLKWSDISSFWI